MLQEPKGCKQNLIHDNISLLFRKFPNRLILKDNTRELHKKMNDLPSNERM